MVEPNLKKNNNVERSIFGTPCKALIMNKLSRFLAVPPVPKVERQTAPKLKTVPKVERVGTLKNDLTY